MSGGAGAFFASSDGASFHANSFIELNLSRPLLRACEALGYHKPTPIQVYVAPFFNCCLILLYGLHELKLEYFF